MTRGTKKLVGVCENCQTEFTYYPYQQTGKYCSNSCQQMFQRNTTTIPKIERGEVNQPNTLKKYLREVRGNRCEVGGCLPVHLGKELRFELHHLDGNSDNNRPSNLQLICPNCHSQLPVSKGKTDKRSRLNKLRRKENLAKVALWEGTTLT